MIIKRLDEIKRNFTEKYNIIRTQEPLQGIIYSLLDVQNFMVETKNIFKLQQEKITDLQAKVKALEQKDSYYPTKEELHKMPLYEGSD